MPGELLRGSFEKRFWAKVDRRGPNECWPWTGTRSDRGYGLISVGKRNLRATRVAWEIANGAEFPADRLACHTCDNPWCVNPAHIWPGTATENIEDSISKGRFKFRQTDSERFLTHCARGHPFHGDNLHIGPRGRRVCRACHRVHNDNYAERRRMLARAPKASGASL